MDSPTWPAGMKENSGLRKHIISRPPGSNATVPATFVHVNIFVRDFTKIDDVRMVRRDLFRWEILAVVTSPPGIRLLHHPETAVE